MALDNFNWKSLFIQEDSMETSKFIQKSVEPKPQATEFTKFPIQSNPVNFQTNTTINSPTSTSTNTNNPFLNEVLEVYQKGFNSLNEENFDFFEFYKSVVAVGVTNPQSYQMAFTMGKSIKSDLTKDFLIEKSKFYVTEIEKVYTKYDTTGNDKKRNLLNDQSSNNTNLSKSIAEIELKIVELQKELEIKKQELSKLASNYTQPLEEISTKIEANNLAKNTILDSIQNVVNGINQYL